MYLKSIEMQGFKSFPDKTKLVFAPGGAAVRDAGTTAGGVTVIVGPNGSGKSNIADAMRWVLGEISSKSLRGSKMEDVIFGGADSRRPMGYAEVSVTFDNTTGFGRLDAPYDEVTVTRRYFRAGESEYLINRKPVRLKDIYELFLNTGIGRDGYSIIGQGRIAEIISRKSEERRGIFEDASGIARFRVKKNETERRLEATEANMIRVRDVFSEVEAQVGPLEKEANKAKRGIVLLEQRKQADISLWLYDTERLSGQIAEAETARAHADFDLSQAADTLTSLEVQSNRLEELNRASRETAGVLGAEITSLTAEQHRLESEFRVRESNIAHAQELIDTNHENKKNLEARLSADETERIAHEEKNRTLTARADALQKELDAGDKRATELKERIDTLDGNIDKLGEDIRTREAEAVDLRVRLSVLENARNSGSDRGSDLVSDMEQYEETARRLEEEVRKRQASVDRYRAYTEENQTALADVDRRLTALNAKYGEAGERLNAVRLERDSVTQRIRTYQSMEEHFEGYNGAVRYIMNQYAQGRVTSFDGQPCGKIYGPLSQVVRVEQPYVLAVETALGANLQHIVVENEATAKAAMYALKRGEAGRATFFPLTSMRPQTVTAEMQDAARWEGYVAVADTLISCEDRFRNVVSSLLGRTLIFDTIDHATAMAKALRYRVRVVTLDGQQINVGGSFTGGSAAQKNGALSRAAEVRRLEASLKELQERMTAAGAELESVRADIRDTEEEKNGYEDKRDLLRVLSGNESAGLEQATAKRDANNTLLARMREDADQLLRQSEAYETDMATLRAGETSLTNTIRDLRELRNEKATAKGDAEEALDRLTEAQTARTISLSELRKDAETEATFAAACAERITATAAEIGQTDDRIRTLTASVADYHTAQAENRAAYAEGERVLNEKIAERTKADRTSGEYETKLAGLREQINRKHEEKENLFKVFTTADSRLQNLNAEKEKLENKLFEDYEMTKTDALALHYPPVTAENRREVLQLQTDCRNKLRAIGHFDPDAVEKYNEVRERYDTMSAQIADMEKSRKELLAIIERLEGEMKTAFSASFAEINRCFGETFSELFGGGSAEVVLTDPENVLESGIEIKAAPPGKIIKSLMQLSGGEQAFIGVALFFAILKVNPTPFCILDEIEAALDEVNVERLAQYIKRYADETQFIMITHRRGTMAAATRLYGVTMPEHGISKVLTLDVADISKNKENDWNGLFK